jgi:hypothetical protein
MILAAVSGCADASPGEVYRLEMSTLSQQEIDCLEHGHQVSAAPRLHLAALTFASASCPHVPPELADGMYSVNAGSAASGSSGASSSSPAGSSGKFHSIRQYKRLSSSILNTPSSLVHRPSSIVHSLSLSWCTSSQRSRSRDDASRCHSPIGPALTGPGRTATHTSSARTARPSSRRSTASPTACFIVRARTEPRRRLPRRLPRCKSGV